MNKMPQDTTCTVQGGHRYNANGVCEWCDAERPYPSATLSKFQQQLAKLSPTDQGAARAMWKRGYFMQAAWFVEGCLELTNIAEGTTP